jgi:hypothetical protein
MLKFRLTMNAMGVVVMLWSAPNKGMRELEPANDEVGQEQGDQDQHEPTKKLFEKMRAGIDDLKNLKD